MAFLAVLEGLYVLYEQKKASRHSIIDFSFERILSKIFFRIFRESGAGGVVVESYELQTPSFR